jgi:hypothetical protein
VKTVLLKIESTFGDVVRPIPHETVLSHPVSEGGFDLYAFACIHPRERRRKVEALFAGSLAPFCPITSSRDVSRQ